MPCLSCLPTSSHCVPNQCSYFISNLPPTILISCLWERNSFNTNRQRPFWTPSYLILVYNWMIAYTFQDLYTNCTSTKDHNHNPEQLYFILNFHIVSELYKMGSIDWTFWLLDYTNAWSWHAHLLDYTRMLLSCVSKRKDLHFTPKEKNNAMYFSLGVDF